MRRRHTRFQRSVMDELTLCLEQLEDEAELVTQGLREAERDRLDVEAELRALEQEERELEGDEQRCVALHGTQVCK